MDQVYFLFFRSKVLPPQNVEVSDKKSMKSSQCPRMPVGQNIESVAVPSSGVIVLTEFIDLVQPCFSLYIRQGIHLNEVLKSCLIFKQYFSIDYFHILCLNDWLYDDLL